MRGHHQPDPLRAAAVQMEAGAPSEAAAKGVSKALPEALVHKAVGDGVHAGRQVGQQENGGSVRLGDVALQTPVVEHGPSVEGVERAPADEIFQHDHEQHFDDSALVSQNAVEVRRSQCLHGQGSVGTVAVGTDSAAELSPLLMTSTLPVVLHTASNDGGGQHGSGWGFGIR